MFVAMMMCLPIAWVARLVEMAEKKKKGPDEKKPLLGGGDSKGGASCPMHQLCTLFWWRASAQDTA